MGAATLGAAPDPHREAVAESLPSSLASGLPLLLCEPLVTPFLRLSLHTLQLRLTDLGHPWAEQRARGCLVPQPGALRLQRLSEAPDPPASPVLGCNLSQ